MILVDLFFIVVSIALLCNDNKSWRFGGAFGLALSLAWLVQDIVTLWWGFGVVAAIVVFLVVSVVTFVVAVQYLQTHPVTSPQDNQGGGGH